MNKEKDYERCDYYSNYLCNIDYLVLDGWQKEMSNSKLVVHTNLSPNCSVPRKNEIDRITIHCVVGQCTAESLGNWFSRTTTQASSNYGVDKDGRVGLYVDEANRSWCSSSRDNDHRAVTIEVASDTTHPYAVTDKAYNALIELVADICKRNGKNKILWFADKEKTLAYEPKDNEMVMTVHRWFANKSCPGEYLYERHAEIAEKVNKILNPEPEMETIYRVQIGAYRIKANAQAQLVKAKTAGFKDAFITEVQKPKQ